MIYSITTEQASELIFLFQIRNVSTVGGATAKETTRRLLRHLLTNKCARAMNWKGKNQKRAFSELQLKDVLFRKLMSCNCKMVYKFNFEIN